MPAGRGFTLGRRSRGQDGSDAAVSVSEAGLRLDQRAGLWRGFSATSRLRAASWPPRSSSSSSPSTRTAARRPRAGLPAPITWISISGSCTRRSPCATLPRMRAARRVPTVRLLDPQRLDALFGARFANLRSMPERPGDPLARLLLGTVRQPKVLIRARPAAAARAPIATASSPHLPGLAYESARCAATPTSPQPQGASRSPRRP